MKTNYINKQLCMECGGGCCKSLPGCALPEDFGPDILKGLTEAFQSNKWAIDWWEGDPTGKHKIDKAYFIRPRIKGIETIFYCAWSGQCTFLSDKGCTLSHESRPSECRLLEPNEGDCISHGATKREAAIIWLPYHDIIHKAVEQ